MQAVRANATRAVTGSSTRIIGNLRRKLESGMVGGLPPLDPAHVSAWRRTDGSVTPTRRRHRSKALDLEVVVGLGAALLLLLLLLRRLAGLRDADRTELRPGLHGRAARARRHVVALLKRVRRLLLL